MPRQKKLDRAPLLNTEHSLPIHEATGQVIGRVQNTAPAVLTGQRNAVISSISGRVSNNGNPIPVHHPNPHQHINTSRRSDVETGLQQPAQRIRRTVLPERKIPWYRTEKAASCIASAVATTVGLIIFLAVIGFGYLYVTSPESSSGSSEGYWFGHPAILRHVINGRRH